MRPEQLAAAALSGLAGLHVLWATGSPWPLKDRAAFTEAVVGRGEFPPPAACLAGAGLLATGAWLVAGHPRRWPALQRAGAAGVTGVLAVRAGLGLAGRTDLLAPGSMSARYRRLDRRLYGPLCLTLAALSAPATRARR